MYMSLHNRRLSPNYSLIVVRTRQGSHLFSFHTPDGIPFVNKGHDWLKASERDMIYCHVYQKHIYNPLANQQVPISSHRAKECEFRFNFRQQDLYPVILKLCRKRPFNW